MIRLLVVVVLCASATLAEPSRVVRYLMNDPVTMWDWGELKLEDALEDAFDIENPNDIMGHLLAEHEMYVRVSVDYNWKGNRLRLLVIMGSAPWVESELPEESARFMCKEVVLRVRQKLGIERDGQPIRRTLSEDESPSSSLHLYFGRHFDMTNSDEPSSLAEELDAMTDLEAMVFYGDPHTGGQNVQCGAPLLYGPIHFVEE